MAAKTRLSYLIDFGDSPIFKAIAYPSIFVAQKALPNGNEFNALSWQSDVPMEKFDDVLATRTFRMYQSDLRTDGWRIENTTVLNLLEKIRTKSKTLNEYIGGRFYRGIVTGLNEAFVIDGKTRNKIISESPASEEHIKPFLRGRDVKRWNITYPDLFLCYIGWDFPIKKYPAILRHLKQYEKSLSERPEVKKGVFPWYALSRYASDYWQEFSQPKIVYPNICKQNEFAWDELGFFINQKAYIIPGASKYLLGVLNSSVTMWLFMKLLPKLQGDFFEPSAIFMEKLPIPVMTDVSQIEKLVERILAAKRTNPQKDVSALEQEINQLVYTLYRLTKEEIAIVEGRE